MSYTKLFDPTGHEDLRGEAERQQPTTGDRRDGKIYVYDAAGEIVLSVNIALATGRPLLVSGPSGGGKSSLAHHVARVLGRRYYEFVVTARTQAQELTWRFDAVRRLADAQVKGLLSRAQGLENIFPYIEPQVLWWIFDQESARRRGRSAEQAEAVQTASGKRAAGANGKTNGQPGGAPTDPVAWEPRLALAKQEWLPENPQLNSCVLLVDEIDKAEPDVPNNLLVELGSLQFNVDLIGRAVRFQGERDNWQARPLVIITTNKERPLPQPFVRRCVVLELPKPKRGLLKSIAAHNFPGRNEELFERVLDALLASRSGQAAAAVSEQPSAQSRDEETAEVSIAEYVDTLRACVTLAASTHPLSQSLLDEIVRRTVWVAKEKALRSQ
jgi:MoxR-like ATPase